MADDNLDNLTLHPFQRQLLYPNGITNIDYTEKKAPAPIKYIGKNKRNILIGIDIHGELNAQDKELLNNLLKACGLGMDDVALVNLNKQEAPFPEILKRLKIENVILFGVSIMATGLSLTDAEEKLMTLENRIFLRTIPLHALNRNVGKKRRLWEALKELFEL